jgi:hypothetical protein
MTPPLHPLYVSQYEIIDVFNPLSGFMSKNKVGAFIMAFSVMWTLPSTKCVCYGFYCVFWFCWQGLMINWWW